MLAVLVVPRPWLPLYAEVVRGCAYPVSWRSIPFPGGPTIVTMVMAVRDTPGCYELALEGLVRVNEAELASGHYPRLYESSVSYAPEEGEQLVYVGAVTQFGEGDCDDLAAWRAAELRLQGEEQARVVELPGNADTPAHAVVLRADGTYEDPSRVLGMV